MSEMIERVAKALSEREGSGPWEGGLMGERGREMWRATARAAIEAMREPTSEMAFADDVKEWPDDAKAAWRAMIDAALTPSLEKA